MGSRFGRLAVAIWTVQPHTFGAAALVQLRADDIPALAEVQDAVMQFRRPAFRRDADSLPLTHSYQSMGVRRRATAPTSARAPKTIASPRPSTTTGALTPNRKEPNMT